MAKTSKKPASQPQPKQPSVPASRPSERQSGDRPLQKGVGSDDRPKK